MPILRSLALAAAVAVLGACTAPPAAAPAASPASVAPPATTEALLASLAGEVILPTYRTLDDQATALDQAAKALAAAPTAEHLAAARAAWQAARAPWELSESHLIGPVKDQELDPALDSWPVERNDLEKVLASDVKLDQAFIASQQPTMKGFHVIEYVLYANEAEALTPRKLEYLTALTGEFKANTVKLREAWEPASGNFLVQYTAPAPGGTFGTSEVALAETLHAMAEICEEVANGKIETPLAANDPTQEESHFSGNSLADFRHNLQGVQAMYLGAKGLGVGHLVAAKDPAVDARARAAIAQALADLDAVPGTFEEAITKHPEALRKAQGSITAVRDLLQQDVSKALTGRVSADAT
jgi:predicted lipoprotein